MNTYFNFFRIWLNTSLDFKVKILKIVLQDLKVFSIIRIEVI